MYIKHSAGNVLHLLVYMSSDLLSENMLKSFANQLSLIDIFLFLLKTLK